MYIRALWVEFIKLTQDQFQYVANYMEAKVLVLENIVQWNKFKAERENLPTVKKVVMISDINEIDDDIGDFFEDFLETGESHIDAADERMTQIKPDDLALLIYTSGTTGPQKVPCRLTIILHGQLKVLQKLSVDLVLMTDMLHIFHCHILEQMFYSWFCFRVLCLGLWII